MRTANQAPLKVRIMRIVNNAVAWEVSRLPKTFKYLKRDRYQQELINGKEQEINDEEWKPTA